MSTSTNSLLPKSAPLISWQDCTLGELIGHGGFGDVYKGRWQGIDVAIKQLILKHSKRSKIRVLMQRGLKIKNQSLSSA